MKRSQLQAIIRETLSEVLNEVTPQQQKVDNLERQLLQAKKDALKAQEDALKKTGQLEEDELNEMAWSISGNKLQRYKKTSLENEVDIPANPSGNLASIINVLRQKEGEIVTDADIQDELGFARPQMVNTQLSNVFAKAPAPPAVAQPGGPGGDEDIDDDGEDELPSGYEDPEGGVAGEMSDEEIDASFARTMGSGEEEPEPDEIETGTSSKVSLSPEEGRAYVDYLDLETRLATVTSDINRETRKRNNNKNKVAGDISGGGDINIDNLRIRQAALTQQIQDLFDEYPSVKALISRRKPSKMEPLSQEPDELDEWTINRLKFYAGIIK